MKKFFAASIVLLLIISFVITAPASAARNTAPTTNRVGNDISWPQCGKTLPTTHAFGIVGVTGGKPTNTNPCLGTQLLWAKKSPGLPTQPNLQLYVNTANPGEVINQIVTWPTNNTDKTGFTPNNPYGVCAGANDLACSWQYGWNRAVEGVIDHFAPAARAVGISEVASSYVWWLDVETSNTWQSGSAAALARNAATLEGATSHLLSKGAKVGVYSTSYQWGVIAGKVSTTSNLNGLDSWLAGAKNQNAAMTMCSNRGLTATSKVTLVQYVAGALDYDYAC